MFPNPEVPKDEIQCATLFTEIGLDEVDRNLDYHNIQMKVMYQSTPSEAVWKTEQSLLQTVHQEYYYYLPFQVLAYT